MGFLTQTKGFTMHKQFYFLSPVEVVKVTPQNMEEVAEWCGGRVAQIENKRKPGQMDKYVWVPTPKGSASSSAYPGMYVTKRIVVTVNSELKTTFSVFRKDYFDKNYFDTPNLAVDATWERADKEARAKQIPKPAAPKKKELKPYDINKLMGEHKQEEDQKLEEAVAVVQEQIPDATLEVIEHRPTVVTVDNGQFEHVPTPEYKAECPACGKIKVSNNSQETATNMIIEHAKTCAKMNATADA